jgi:chaperonin GroES
MVKVKVKPIGGNILVKPLSQESVSISGIVLPDTASKEKPQKGEIIALGSGKKTPDGKVVEFSVKVGDIVVFKKYSPDEVEIDGEDYLIMDEDAILCVVEK